MQDIPKQCTFVPFAVSSANACSGMPNKVPRALAEITWKKSLLYFYELLLCCSSSTAQTSV